MFEQKEEIREVCNTYLQDFLECENIRKVTIFI